MQCLLFCFILLLSLWWVFYYNHVQIKLTLIAKSLINLEQTRLHYNERWVILLSLGTRIRLYILKMGEMVQWSNPWIALCGLKYHYPRKMSQILELLNADWNNIIQSNVSQYRVNYTCLVWNAPDSAIGEMIHVDCNLLSLS